MDVLQCTQPENNPLQQIWNKSLVLPLHTQVTTWHSTLLYSLRTEGSKANKWQSFSLTCWYRRHALPGGGRNHGDAWHTTLTRRAAWSWEPLCWWGVHNATRHTCLFTAQPAQLWAVSYLGMIIYTFSETQCTHFIYWCLVPRPAHSICTV